MQSIFSSPPRRHAEKLAVTRASISKEIVFFRDLLQASINDGASIGALNTNDQGGLWGDRDTGRG
jgi:hypothetical protein